MLPLSCQDMRFECRLAGEPWSLAAERRLKNKAAVLAGNVRRCYPSTWPKSSWRGPGTNMVCTCQARALKGNLLKRGHVAL